jgi:DNA invertase Pin-like site-specific DNA recombinase
MPRLAITFLATLAARLVKEAKVMAQGKFVSYLRVSTARQGRSGLGLEAQRESVSNYLNGGRWKLVEEVIEVESGKKNDRPELARALRLCRMKQATLLVAKLDRLARNVAFISTLMESGVDFTAVDFPTANRLTVHVLAAVAEHEAAMISARTKAALQAAKRRGTKLGGDRGNIQRIGKLGRAASAVVRGADAAKRNADTLAEIQAITGGEEWSLQRIADALNERGFKTARGGQWSPTQVLRVLQSGGAE